METENTIKKPRVKKTEPIHVHRETKKRLLSELQIANRKDLGRRITADDFVALSLSLVQPEHLEALKSKTLTNEDRLELRYREHCAAHGKVSKDEFLGMLLTGGKEDGT